MLLSFFLLYQFNEGLHNSPLVCIVLLGLSPEPVSRCLFGKLCAFVCTRSTTCGNFSAPLRSICTKLAYIGSAENRRSAELFPGVLGKYLSLFSSSASLASSFIQRDSLATKALPLR